MNKSKLLATVFAVAAFSFTSAQAADDVAAGMEKCKVVNSEGKGMILENHGNSGTNKAGDPEAFIMVPKGECDKINNGDLTGVSDEVKAKIDSSMMEN